MKFFIFVVLYFFATLSFSQNLNLTCSDKSVLKNIEFAGKNFSPKPLTAAENEKLKQEKIKLKTSLCQKNNSCFSSVSKVGLQPDQISSLTEILAYTEGVEKTKDENISETEKHIAHLEYYLEYCEKISGRTPTADTLKISYNDDGFNKNKNGIYIKKDLESIVEKAIYEGVDPYLAISILLLENPPVATNKSAEYKKQYGTLPIDAIATYDIIGCNGKKDDSLIIKDKTAFDLAVKKYQALVKLKDGSAEYVKLFNDLQQLAYSASDENLENLDLAYTQIQCEAFKKNPALRCAGAVGSQKNIFPLKINYMKKSGFRNYDGVMCSSMTQFRSGDAPKFEAVNKDDPEKIKNRCCVSIQTNREDDDHYQDILGSLAMKYMKRTVQDCVGSAPTAYCVQKYNGLGCFNCTEKMDNQCLNGVVMADRPVYGHRALDLMAQSLMTNPDLNKMILEHSNRLKKPVLSILCSGQTSVSIDPRKYLFEQKDLLLNGDKKFYSYAAKTSAGIKLKSAESEDEKRIYLEKEQKRRLACEKFFKEK